MTPGSLRVWIQRNLSPRSLTDALGALAMQSHGLRWRRQALGALNLMSPQEIRTGLRERLTVRKAVAIVVILFCFGYVYRTFMSPSRPSLAPGVFYYDLGTGQLFTGRLVDLPPIPAPSGLHLPDGSDAGVRAHVYACGSCANVSDHFVAYIETTTPPVRDLLASIKELDAKVRNTSAEATPNVPASAPAETPAAAAANDDDSAEAPVAPQPTAAQALAHDIEELNRLREQAEQGHLVALPGTDPRWVPMFSDEGNDLVRSQIESKCGEKTPMECRP